MTSNGQKRTRSERIASLALPPSQWERAWSSLNRRDVLARIGLAMLTSLVTLAVIQGWDPPFAYRSGYTPRRDVVATVPFSMEDVEETEASRRHARSQVRYVYANDPEPLVQLRALLRNMVVEVTSAGSLGELDPRLWREFRLPQESAEPPPRTEQERQFEQFREAFTGKENLDRFDRALAEAFDSWEKRGLLKSLPQEPEKGNQEEILVRPKDESGPPEVVKTSDVLLGDASLVREAFEKHVRPPEVAERLFAWTQPKLAEATTLTQVDVAKTRQEMARAAGAVQPSVIHFDQGRVLAKGGKPLGEKELELLRLEYEADVADRSLAERFDRGAAVLAMVFTMLMLCGIYMRYRQRGPLARLRRLAGVLFLAVLVVAGARWANTWHGEIIPLMLFGMTMGIVFRQELGLLLSGAVALVIVLAIGHGFYEFLLLMGVTTVAVLNMGRIRNRTKLIYVGLFAGSVAAVLSVFLGLIDNQPFGTNLFKESAWNGLCALAAGFLMAGLLPFVERVFGVLTDLSLLELGDVAHPLLQELVRRAPSTYNHSITVGSIGEAAAESIHAQGLLVRVGAYFHDIGKMLKPDYFIENQGSETSAHEDLVPAMSTLVIVAHIKDGADLARQYHIPQPIVDLINQHHGTTLVEFFYGKASEQKQAEPDGGDVDESTYRYPGPKPQTKEAAVLMLADGVESASRTLVEPTPARIERLVRDVSERRLHGGQFDESGLTLRELRTIEKSLAMSLISIYHGRIKYPDQRTA
jgi:putative nucleotidyltransferase with HDIG domain